MPRKGPEWRIQRDLKRFLHDRDWLVEQTHGNLYQTGFPDLFLAHERWGYRWVDVKNPKSYSFTKAQRIKWPLWESFGVGVWILTGASQSEYDKLFGPPNWRDYWKESWEMPDIDQLLADLWHEEDGAESEAGDQRHGGIQKREIREQEPHDKSLCL
jgi:hypothetical protein